ncbi:MAG: hypothetical protein KAG84_06090 [Bacteroidales bacterium]|nr:hypothetical protein [Bacteroidales bacterium]
MKQGVIIIFIVISSHVYAQIGGLSASKISSLTVDVVDHNNIEFEPSFTFAKSYRYWDSSGNINNLFSTSDSVNHVSGMNFRFTYGLFNKVEFGLSVSSTLDVAKVGVRYILFQKEKFGIAAIAGFNIPMGNSVVDQSIRATSSIMNAGFGFVGHYAFNDKLSIDITTQYTHFLKKTVDNNVGGLYINSDIGYYVFNNKLMLITGLGFINVANNAGNHQVMTVYPGISIEPGGDFLIVITVPFDVMGKNENKNVGFNFALTLTFD